MATRKFESLALLKRVEKAGWRTEQTTSGWRIRDPRGGVHTLHLANSTMGANKKYLDDFIAAGLLDDEADTKQKTDTAKKQALAEARAAAEAKAQRLANQATLSKKAAGPYLIEPEPCDPGWLTQPHPAPWMRWMYIDAKTASLILEHHNNDNRKLGQDLARDYAAIMHSGQWHLTHQGIAFDTRGVGQDLQHRMRAIEIVAQANPDIQIPFAVFVGMPPENFIAIDEGRMRNAAQMLAKDGETYAKGLTGVVKLVRAYRSEDPRTYARRRTYSAQTFETFNADSDAIRSSVAWGMRHYRRVQCTAGPLSAAHYLILQANPNLYAHAFLEGLASRCKHNTDRTLPVDDPRSTLLRRFAYKPKGVRAIETFFWIITAWNNLVRGHHPQNLIFTERSTPPQILLCKPGDGAPPRALEGEV